jgi:DNA-binding XRE family transcriptional regulator
MSRTHTEKITGNRSGMISALIAAAKLPASKRQRLLKFMARYTELLRKMEEGVFDHQDQEELAVLAEGIGEMLAGQPVQLIEHLIDPSSPEMSKARKWFCDMGQRIRKLRAAKGLRQNDLAKKTGLSQGAISRIERGLLAPSHATVAKIAEALEVPPSQIDPGLE